MSLSNQDNSIAGARNLGILNGINVRRGILGTQDKKDFYQFSVIGKSSLALSLKKLKDNVNLSLLDASGRVLGKSKKPDNKPESLNLDLEPGTYYVRVDTRSRRDRTPYRLTLALQGLGGVQNPGGSDSGGSNPGSSGGNTAPSLSISELTLSGGATAIIGGNLLQAADSQQGAGQLQYTLTASPQNGQLYLKGQLLQVGAQFLQSDINSGLLSYQSFPATTQLTNNTHSDEGLYAVSDNQVFFDSFRGNIGGYSTDDLFAYNSNSKQIVQLTTSAQIRNQFRAGDGDNVMWASLLDQVGEEFFFYQGATGEIVQITNNTTNQHQVIGVSGSNAFWIDISNGQRRLYVYNGTTKKTTLLANNVSLRSANAPPAVWLDGSHAVWISRDDGDQEIYFYNGITDQALNLSNNSTNLDEFPRFSANLEDTDKDGMSGSHIVWESYDGNDWELHYYSGSGQPIQLTNNVQDDFLVGMSGSHIVSRRSDGSDDELFFYNGLTGQTAQLTNNTIEDRYIEGISGPNVVWSSFEGTDDELFFYNGTEQPINLTGTDGNLINESFKGMDGSTVFWISQNSFFAFNGSGQPVELTTGSFLGRDGANAVFSRRDPTNSSLNNLFLYKGNTGQIVQLTADGTDLVRMSGSNVVWSRGNALFLYKDSTGQTSSLPNGALFQGMSGSNVLWKQSDGFDQELFFSNGSFASADSFGFTVADGTGEASTGTFNITIT